MNLILVRHGETDWNRQKRFQGHIDIPLNSQGIWQAQQAARALADLGIEQLFSSNLLRAQITAEAIAGVCGCAVQTDPRLREKGFGNWEGLTYAEIKEQDADGFARWREDPSFYTPSGGEGFEVAARRVARAWQEIEAVAAETVALVSHGGTLRILLRQLLGLAPDSYWHIKLDNASLSILKISRAGNRIISINDTRHLYEQLAFGSQLSGND
jgi:alpha-ribazole phosphatase